MNEAIVANGLTRRFDGNPAVERLVLHVKQGEVFGLLGHNGAGKTTTVRLLNGVLPADEGDATVLGLSPRTEGHKLRRRTGVLTETPAVDDRLSGRENLVAYAEMFDLPRAAASRRVDDLLSEFGLAEAARQRTSEYSKGMRQRLALARTLLHEPDLLFLDEPTSGLDPVAADQVRRLVERMARKESRTVVLCTHNLTEAARLCDRVAVLRRGRVVAMGAPSALARGTGPMRLRVQVAPGDEAAAQRALADHAPEAGAGAVTLPAIDEARVPDVVAALVRAGVRVHRVQPEERSLEDFYLELERREAA